MSLTSLGQDQSKFGSKNALNRRVIVIYSYLVVCIVGVDPNSLPLLFLLVAASHIWGESPHRREFGTKCR